MNNSINNIISLIMTEHKDEVYKDEEWKNMFPPFENVFMISNYGRIKNLKTNHIKAQQISSTGYMSCKLNTSENKKTFDIHRVVAKLFIGECPKGNYVNHKDGDKKNNKVSNLEYVTPSQNSIHARNTGLIKKQRPSIKVDISKIETIDIPDYSDYCMDKDGNLYSKVTKIKLRTHSEPTGYVRLTLQEKGKKNRKHFYQHCMLAKLFIPNPKNLPFVNHINGNKHDNRIENLEWCTASENMKHNSKLKEAKGIKTIAKAKKVHQINDNDEIIATFKSIKEASEKTNVCYNHIIDVCSGKRKTAGTFKWKYVNNPIDNINQSTS